MAAGMAILWAMGNPHVWTGAIGGLLAIAVRALYLALGRDQDGMAPHEPTSPGPRPTRHRAGEHRDGARPVLRRSGRHGDGGQAPAQVPGQRGRGHRGHRRGAGREAPHDQRTSAQRAADRPGDRDRNARLASDRGRADRGNRRGAATGRARLRRALPCAGAGGCGREGRRTRRAPQGKPAHRRSRGGGRRRDLDGDAARHADADRHARGSGFRAPPRAGRRHRAGAPAGGADQGPGRPRDDGDRVSPRRGRGGLHRWRRGDDRHPRSVALHDLRKRAWRADPRPPAGPRPQPWRGGDIGQVRGAQGSARRPAHGRAHGTGA